MKKIVVTTMFLILSLIFVGCKETKYLDKLINLNGEYALNEAQKNLSYISYDVKSTWTTSIWNEYFLMYDNLYEEEEITELFIEYVDRVVITNFDNGLKIVEVLECYSVEEAVKLYDELDSIQLYRNENLIYTNTPFAWLLIYGNKEYIDFYECPVVKTTIINVDYNIRYEKTGEISIPNEIEVISAGSFHSLKKITKVIFNENIKVIGNNAFGRCVSIEEVVLNEGLKYINFAAFINCSKIKNIKIPSSVEYIGMNSFYGCSNLEYIVIPNNVKFIGKDCFSNGNIFCLIESKPEKWDLEFYGGTAKVYWAGEWEYNEDGIPVPIE